MNRSRLCAAREGGIGTIKALPRPFFEHVPKLSGAL